MSNAAVIKLQRKTISGNSVWLDDNFGESVHLHINDFRVDLTCEGFERMVRDARFLLDDLIRVKDFHAADYDPVFLEQMLWKKLMHLTEVKRDRVKLSELWMNEPRLVRINQSRMYRYTEGKAKSLKKKQSDHFGQSSSERMANIQNSIQEKGYDENLGWFVIYGDDNIIRDGQHRACSLLREHGDITVPVIRLYFSNYMPINTSLRSSPLGFFYHCFYRLREIRRETRLFSKASLKSLLKKGYFVTKSKHRKALFSLSEEEARLQRSILGK